MSTPGSPRWRARWVLLSFILTWVITQIIETALNIEGAVTVGGLLIGITILFVMTLAWVIGVSWLSMSSTSKLRPILYGIGWALILGGLATILNLADVYWAPSGNEILLAVALFVIVVAIAAVRGSDRVESV